MVNIASQLTQATSGGELAIRSLMQGLLSGVSSGEELMTKLMSKRASGSSDMRKQLFKSKLEKKENQETAAEDLEHLDELEGLSEYSVASPWEKLPFSKGGRAKIARTLGISTEGAQKASKLDQFGFWVSDKLYTKYNKGQISEAKLQRIQELAPHTGLSQAENKARINAMRELVKKEGHITDKDIDKAIKKTSNNSSSKSKKEKPSLQSFFEE